MFMILNDVLTKQNVFTKILLKDGNKELPKELKVKIMRIRMFYAKIVKSFESELQEFAQEIIPEELKLLASKSNRTDSENARMQELSTIFNSEYSEFVTQKGLESVAVIDDTFTFEEYSEILEVNAGNNVVINGTTVLAPDFMELVYTLFVKED